jgi:serine/threonine protein kinase/Tfp pilus assembly protein PilF
MIGKTISHYKILEKLGEGGMGVVYKAHDTKLDRIVALKFLPAKIDASQEEISRFGQEARAISALNHPNIETIYDVDEADGQKYLVLEYIPGGTLNKKLKQLKSKDQRFSVTEVLNYGLQLAEGLAHAHRHHIIHRDVKTDNILLTEESKVKLTDFGLAKLRGSVHKTKTGSTLGTLAYMSPEQIRGEVADHRSDLFSFGVVLYELLASQLPFSGDYEAAVSYAILNDRPHAIRSVRPEVPPELEKIVYRCLEKDREKRYQEADEIITDLRTVQQQTPEMKTMRKKNVRLPYYIGAALFMLVVIVAGFLFLWPQAISPAQEKSIAVLPFVDMSPQKDQEYFCDGMTEELINRLSNIQELRVPARTSAFVFKGRTEDIKEIGSKLKVMTVLEGSVRKAGDNLRITAQLINVADGYHLWSETYDRTLQDVFVVQDEISRAIVDALKIKLMGRQENVTRHYTENSEAYQYYLKGRYYWNKRTKEGLNNAIEFFEKAIETDPDYALAYAGLSDAWGAVGWYRYASLKTSFEKAKEAAIKALEIDNTLAEAHTSLAHVLEAYYWDWQEAEKEYRRAIELNPRYPTAHHWYSLFLMTLGRPDEAVAEAKKALEMDPLSLIINENVGDILRLARRYDEAIEQLQRTLELDPDFQVARWTLVNTYFDKGMYDQFFTEYLKICSPELGPILREVYTKSGIRGFLEKSLELAIEKSRHSYVSSWRMVTRYSDLGKINEAFDWLEKAYKDHSIKFTYLRADKTYDCLRSDPRYSALLKKAGLVK